MPTHVLLRNRKISTDYIMINTHMGDLVGHYIEKTRLVFLSHLYVFPFLCIVYYLFTVLTGRMGMVGLWLHFAVFLFVI